MEVDTLLKNKPSTCPTLKEYTYDNICFHTRHVYLIQAEIILTFLFHTFQAQLEYILNLILNTHEDYSIKKPLFIFVHLPILSLGRKYVLLAFLNKSGYSITR